jgi:hypothetical protein
MTDNTPEYVAFLLMKEVNEAEGTSLPGQTKRTRNETLDLYAECLRAVRSPVARSNIGKDKEAAGQVVRRGGR